MAEQAPEGEGEAQLLVSEFPPPPTYYKFANQLTPPSIPKEALARGTRRAARAAAKALAESERMRLGQTSTDAIFGGEAMNDEEEGDVVAVFGEIVEDPNLIEVADICEDPAKIRDEVHRLNRKVMALFVGLAKDLVNDPLKNKERRDELSHNIFLMLKECNKFREYQARENLIELLEKQLEGRRSLLNELKEELQKVDEILG
mmetsp:Transcript_23630/g.33853  ORF Transcript_23630/g.33853 Transcript_23630/m.33853 type:complete len:203 (-) Transcript_23630:17-625(-)